MGVVPNLFLRPMGPAVDRVVQRMGAHQQRTVRAEPPPGGVRLADVIPASPAEGGR
jgi:hypothetical protein